MKRLLQIGILLACLAFLSWFGHRHLPWLDLNTCMADPERYDGALVEDFREPLIAAVYQDGFLLQQKNGPSIRVQADTAGLGLRKGAYVGLRARYHREGYLEALSLNVAEGRRRKIYLSLIPLLLLLPLLAWRFRWNVRGWYLEPRDNA